MNNDQIDSLVDLHIKALEILQNVDSRATDEAPKPELTEYRLDGFSVEVSPYGGRRHEVVDEALAALRRDGNGDIADEADQFFVFREEDAPELIADSKVKFERARYAVDRNLSEFIQRGQPAIMHAPYKLKLLKPEPALNRHFELIDGHAVVFLGQRFEPGKGWTRVTPGEAMQRYARLLERNLD